MLVRIQSNFVEDCCHSAAKCKKVKGEVAEAGKESESLLRGNGQF